MEKKTRIWLAAAVCLVLCAAIAILTLGSRKPVEPPQADEPPPTSTDRVTVNPIIPAEGAKTAGQQSAPPERDDEEIGDTPAGTDQTIQPEATKPPEPSDEQLADPTKTPDGEKVTSTPTPVDHGAVASPSPSPSPSAGQPQHGDTKDGMIYVNGFGWIQDEGGGASGTIADDMYENGNKIGIMD